MKTASLFAIAIGLGILVGSPARSQNTNNVSTSMNFVSVPVHMVLDVYKDLSKSELVIASDVQHVNHGITLHAGRVSHEVLEQIIQQALLKQAGVVITRLDDKRVSVTYNDQLPLEP